MWMLIFSLCSCKTFWSWCTYGIWTLWNTGTCSWKGKSPFGLPSSKYFWPDSWNLSIGDCEDVDACLKEPHYKTIVPTESRKQLTNINGYTREVWKELICAHVSKMNYLVNGRFELPNKIESQELIFDKQLDKHILHKCPKVAVLSAFPVYVLDYFGADTLKEKLEE